jgi:hypothetical protein
MMKVVKVISLKLPSFIPAQVRMKTGQKPGTQAGHHAVRERVVMKFKRGVDGNVSEPSLASIRTAA